MILNNNKKITELKYLNEFLTEEIAQKTITYSTLWKNERSSNALKGTEVLRLSKGLISSYHDNEPCYSITHSKTSVYYNGNEESDFEKLLRNNWSPNAEEFETARLAIELINKYRITKYNYYPHILPGFFKNNGYENILLIDQTTDDDTVELGCANEKTFEDMLLYVFEKYPHANIYVKMHNDTIHTKKESFLLKLIKKHNLESNTSLTIIDKNYNVASFFNFIDQVFTVTSNVGFEALIRGKKVTCFGLPFYSGWGLTEDMQVSTKPKPKRNIFDLFIALMIKKTYYINPFDGKKGSILDLLEYISLQQRHHNKNDIVMYKSEKDKENIDLFFHVYKNDIIQIEKEKQLKEYSNDLFICDKYKNYQEIKKHEKSCFFTDGFLFKKTFNDKNVASLITDYSGSYFDPKFYSDLEFTMNTEQLTTYESYQAKIIISELIAYYNNLENQCNNRIYSIVNKNKNTILVIGEEDSEDLTYGSSDIKNSVDLLEYVCKNNKNCNIVYKPFTGEKSKKTENKSTFLNLDKISRLNNNNIFVDKDSSIYACIKASNEVHVINSKYGIDGLIYGKKVFTYGYAFYSGYGLTYDLQKFDRPRKKLELYEIIAFCYLLYPKYISKNKDNFISLYTAIKEDFIKIGNEPELKVKKFKDLLIKIKSYL